jgi:hypothetical protein
MTKLNLLSLVLVQEQEERVRGEQTGHVHQPVHHLPSGQRLRGPPGPLGPQAQLFRELQKVGQILVLVVTLPKYFA